MVYMWIFRDASSKMVLVSGCSVQDLGDGSVPGEMGQLQANASGILSCLLPMRHSDSNNNKRLN